jgi:hypothetical protein
MKPCVFVHTNHMQFVGAVVSEHSMRRNSSHADKFDVKLLEYEACSDLFQRYEGRKYLREGDRWIWQTEDLQSFTPLRFMAPEAMGYEGRALVVDPDVFAVGDVWELLDRDMEGRAILCRPRPGQGHYTSVMLLDCAKLKHWRFAEDFGRLFTGEREYKTWMKLGYEDQSTIGPIEPEWNDFDRLTPATKVLHNTHGDTQPWKAGLKIQYTPTDRSLLDRLRRKLLGRHALLGTHAEHPDLRQVQLFFAYLSECLENGLLSEAQLREHMAAGYVRHDAFEVMQRSPPVEQVLRALAA